MKKKKNFFASKTSRITVVMLLIMLVMFILSYIFDCVKIDCKKAEWLSSCFNGIAGGILGGYLIYILTNFRTYESRSIQGAREDIMIVLKKCRDTKWELNWFSKHYQGEDDSIETPEFDRVFETYDSLITHMMEIPEKSFEQMGIDEDSWIKMCELTDIEDYFDFDSGIWKDIPTLSEKMENELKGIEKGAKKALSLLRTKQESLDKKL